MYVYTRCDVRSHRTYVECMCSYWYDTTTTKNAYLSNRSPRNVPFHPFALVSVSETVFPTKANRAVTWRLRQAPPRPGPGKLGMGPVFTDGPELV